MINSLVHSIVDSLDNNLNIDFEISLFKFYLIEKIRLLSLTCIKRIDFSFLETLTDNLIMFLLIHLI